MTSRAGRAQSAQVDPAAYSPFGAAARRRVTGAPSSTPDVWQLIDSRSVGGAERHITNLARELDRVGIRTEVVQYADYGPNPWFKQMDAAGVTWRVLDGTFSGLSRDLRVVRPRLLHTHGYKAGLLGRLAALACGVPLVSTFHPGQRSPLPLGFYEWLDEWTSFVGGRIAVSEGVSRRLPFSADVIPSWVEIPDRALSSPLPRRVAFVGRLSPEKQPDAFCQLLSQSPPGLEWHVYGDGPMRDELERRYGAAIRFHGVVADLEAVWRSIGLLVMPSRYEGLPLAALEALAHGVPVLAARVGGLPSIVIDELTGWLFEPQDLTGALRGLRAWDGLSLPQQALLRQECRSHVRERFSADAMVPRILQVYERSSRGMLQETPAHRLGLGRERQSAVPLP